MEPTAHPEFWQNPGWAVVRFKPPITEPWNHPEFICVEAEILNEDRNETNELMNDLIQFIYHPRMSSLKPWLASGVQ